MYEHVRSLDPALARKQDRFSKPWRAFNVGCHPNRDTFAAIAGAGFDTAGLERFDMNEKGVPKVVRPQRLAGSQSVAAAPLTVHCFLVQALFPSGRPWARWRVSQR